MTPDQTVERLFTACRSAGVDPDIVFAHYDDADVQAYGEALGAGWIPLDQLHLWMTSTARTIAEGRCLCRTCKLR